MRQHDLTAVQTNSDIHAYLERYQDKSLLRFIACGSVDDGKSTLIGRLLYDCKLIFDDQLAQVRKDSKRKESQGHDIDFALLLDGLSAEREQGITIDVSYRFFSTEKRKFIVTDAPGHEQYTRNMVTGASNAELAIILVDARKGVSTQTRRHSYLCHLLGIKKFVLAVNKMDLVGYEEKIFDDIVKEFKDFSDGIGITDFVAIPLSGLKGDNVAIASAHISWYDGPSLLAYLESVELAQIEEKTTDFRMPVQWVNRPNSDFRGFSGRVAEGRLKLGERVCIQPSGTTSQVSRIVTFDGDLAYAEAGQSITIILSDDVDCSRGQIITTAQAPLGIADQFKATLVWLDEEALIPGRAYYLKIGTNIVTASVASPDYQLNVNSLEKIAAKTLSLNAIGVANVTTDRPIPFSKYAESRRLGGFILIDKSTNRTVCAGLIKHDLRRAQNIHWHNTTITRDHHAKIKNQRPMVLWLTGISGAGKSTIANAVEKKLAALNYHTFLLDGDNIRHGLNKDLGFTEADRIENIRRVGEVAKLMAEAGLIVITAFISPFRIEREMVRKMVQANEFMEIFVDTPLSVAEERDVKGLYAKARAGELKNFTGIDSAYENPVSPELRLDTTRMDVEKSADKIIQALLERQR